MTKYFREVFPFRQELKMINFFGSTTDYRAFLQRSIKTSGSFYMFFVR
jgi:hypothetical protein